MSHRPAWTCTSCAYQLGEVLADGSDTLRAIRVWVPAPLISDALVAVECPRCHHPQTWERQMVTREAG